MDRWLLGLLAGLVGGAGGALATHLLLPPRDAPPEAPAAQVSRPQPESQRAGGAGGPVLEARPEDTLSTRLERIERLLEAAARSRAEAAADPAALALVRKAIGEELEARMGALKPAEGEGKGKAAGKKRVTLSEAARELDLTSGEEAELRRIYADSQEKILKIVAGPDGDVDAVRREMDEAKKDPKRGAQMMAKYLPKVLPRLGEFMQVGLEREAAVQAAVGPDKAARLDNRFDVIEANPLGGMNEMRIEASAR
jgi:hypothetical protein